MPDDGLWRTLVGCSQSQSSEGSPWAARWPKLHDISTGISRRPHVANTLGASLAQIGASSAPVLAGTSMFDQLVAGGFIALAEGDPRGP